KTRMMGILNLTPDSFYEGSRIDPESEKALLRRAGLFLESGAPVLDLGAESTRPGSSPISEEEEAARLIPALRSIRRAFPEAVLSADTWKSSVARKAVEAGADIINDISGLGFDPALMSTVAETGTLLVLSHIQGSPADMQKNPVYKNTVEDILDYFEERLAAAEDGGIQRERIIIDPGLGFGKGYGDNLKILRHIEAFRIFGRPLLVGHSRKGFIGRATGGKEAEERLEGTLAVTAWCALAGVSLVRVHDVEENRRVLATIDAISGKDE
ncbi:MAG: dihydropteroate synthase, partial [Synergistaceae bacterium]|nr:dihydropteroate synthase [Synergistaceae bacterium]